MFKLERPVWHYGAIVGLVALPSVAGILAHCSIIGTRAIESCPKVVARGNADPCPDVGGSAAQDGCCVPTDASVQHSCAREVAGGGLACAGG